MGFFTSSKVRGGAASPCPLVWAPLTWCANNAMKLNNDKCLVMSFVRSPNNWPNFNHTIHHQALKTINEVCDLNVIFIQDLHPGQQFSMYVPRQIKLLDLSLRSTRGPFSLTTLKTLYMTHVQSRFEYNSPIWSSHQLGLISTLEKVQTRFVRFLGIRMGYNFNEVLINDVRTYLDLQTLLQRKTLLDYVFLFKIVNGILDCPKSLGKLVFQIMALHTSNKITFLF